MQLQLLRTDGVNGKIVGLKVFVKSPVEHKPDAIIKSPSGAKIALELHQTMQTTSRYQPSLKTTYRQEMSDIGTLYFSLLTAQS
ncbi:hypothetical protein [Vibrio parahaemolyticus]|uniref:hypothetical protein n=1 Tax=Vibrio parahaemolyticus TaxID=670 RepID=UPI001F368A0B|nr:hypothetical protein [Vibrio parahaemolyticus]